MTPKERIDELLEQIDDLESDLEAARDEKEELRQANIAFCEEIELLEDRLNDKAGTIEYLEEKLDTINLNINLVMHSPKPLTIAQANELMDEIHSLSTGHGTVGISV